MISKKVTPLLLAASVLACGFTGAFISNQSANAITRVDELSDVHQNVWAYTALKNLVEKYNVIEGYPDKTFRGAKYANRYELAAALNAAMKAVGKDIARLGAEKADKKDLATIARLQQEFANELTALKARTDALEARATKIEAKNDEQDNRLALLEKLKISGDVSFGGYSDIAGNPHDEYTDGISAVGRTRINVDYSMVEDKEDSMIGEGTIHTRLVAAFGRPEPLAADDVGYRYANPSIIAEDASAFNQGFGGVRGTGTDLKATAYVDSAFYDQKFKLMGQDDWKTGATLTAGLLPWRELFFQSPYQGDENTQFQNTAFINNPALIPSKTAPRLAVAFEQGLGKYANLKLTTDMAAIDSKNVTDYLAFTTEANLDYNLGFINQSEVEDGLKGNLVGGYYFLHANENGRYTELSQTLNGFYVGLNQEVYKGIGLFTNFALNQSGREVVRFFNKNLDADVSGFGLYNAFGVKQAWTIGTQVPVSALPDFLTFGKRQNDIMGLAYSHIWPIHSDDSEASDHGYTKPERALEMYYNAKLTDRISLVPSMQLIFDRMGDEKNDTNVILGLRSSFSF
jgi:hypothetical protein